jgi:hypothetical protein
MHTRYPSHTFTSVSLFAQTDWNLTDQPALPTVFYQGSTIQLDVMLEVNGQPLEPSTHQLDFVLKKSTNAENILFRTEITERPENTNPGFISVKLPKAVSDRLRPGVYYYAFQATEKASQRVFPPYTGTFSLELSAASPAPNLGIVDGEPTALGEGGTADELLTPAENTGPHTPDIGRPF